MCGSLVHIINKNNNNKMIIIIIKLNLNWDLEKDLMTSPDAIRLSKLNILFIYLYFQDDVLGEGHVTL